MALAREHSGFGKDQAFAFIGDLEVRKDDLPRSRLQNGRNRSGKKSTHDDDFATGGNDHQAVASAQKCGVLKSYPSGQFVCLCEGIICQSSLAHSRLAEELIHFYHMTEPQVLKNVTLRRRPDQLPMGIQVSCT